MQGKEGIVQGKGGIVQGKGGIVQGKEGIVQAMESEQAKAAVTVLANYIVRANGSIDHLSLG